MVTASKLVCIVADDSSVRRAPGRLMCSHGFDAMAFASDRKCRMNTTAESVGAVTFLYKPRDEADLPDAMRTAIVK
jgi:FixJ family two-component response regulator